MLTGTQRVNRRLAVLTTSLQKELHEEYILLEVTFTSIIQLVGENPMKSTGVQIKVLLQFLWHFQVIGKLYFV